MGRLFRPAHAENHGEVRVIATLNERRQDRKMHATPGCTTIDTDKTTELNETSELRCALDEHFMTLKCEFEEKTATEWTQLRPCGDDWQWVDDVVGNTNWEEEFL